MREVVLYFEGKARFSKKDEIDLRTGFRSFLTRYSDRFKSVKLIACDGKPIGEFAKGIKGDKTNSIHILLKDADLLIKSKGKSKQYRDEPLPKLQLADSEWKKQGVVADETQLHFMVIETEAWFYADLDQVALYFGDKFRMPGNVQQDIEKIPKNQVVKNLEDATKICSQKYSKGKHPQVLLTKIDPNKVAACAPHCKRLFDTLTQKLKELE